MFLAKLWGQIEQIAQVQKIYPEIEVFSNLVVSLCGLTEPVPTTPVS